MRSTKPSLVKYFDGFVVKLKNFCVNGLFDPKNSKMYGFITGTRMKNMFHAADGFHGPILDNIKA